jgi:hypothetical protein
MNQYAMQISLRRFCPLILFFALTPLASCGDRSKNQLEGSYVWESNGQSAHLRFQNNYAGLPELWTPSRYSKRENMILCKRNGNTLTTDDNRAIFVIQDSGDLLQVLDGGVAVNRTFRKQAQSTLATATPVSQTSAKTPSPRTTVASTKQEVSLSQNAFFIEYYTNKAAFYHKYQGVPVRLQSEVFEIGADFIRIRKNSNWLDCFFDAAAAPAFETLKVGQPVTIVCFVSKRNEPFGLQMQSCRLP